MIRPAIACTFQSLIGELWGNDDFSDFCVVVENTNYQCHRFILRACSKFFDSLLRCDMKETRKACTTLPGITSDVFDVIMNFVYRGIDDLTQGNVVSVWKAAHQLQIDYLMKECEDFVITTISIDNYLEYYDCARLLQSKQAVQVSYDFMINNLNHFRNTETFLELTVEEMYVLVESHNLNVKFKELVVKSILQWVIHIPTFCSESEILVSDNSKARQRISFGRDNSHTKENGVTDEEEGNDMSTLNASANEDKYCKYKDRVIELPKLLRAARLSFLRPEWLQHLINHPVISTNKEALAEVLNVYFYQQKAHRDYWSLTDVHGASSDMTHVMVYVDGQRKHCKMYSLDNGSTHVLCQLPTWYEDISLKVSLAVSNQMLFLGEKSWNLKWKSHICIWRQFIGWTKYAVAVDGALDILLPHGQQFYMTYSRARKWYQFHLGKIVFDTVRTDYPVVAAFSYKRYILTLEGVQDDENVTCVMCYDTVTKQKTRLQDWDDPPENTISFRCGDNVYILQGNGTLRLVISNDVEDDDDDDDESMETDNDDADRVLFQLVTKLWDFNWEPYGAVMYKDQLIIFGSQTDHSATWMTSVSGNYDFKTIKIIQIDSSSECHPMIVPKAWLM